MRILHLNDVANVASILVQSAQEQGYDWQLRRLPPVRRPLLRAALARAGDLAGWIFSCYLGALSLKRHGRGRSGNGRSGGPSRGPALIHVHYLPNAYYALVARRPFVIHVHGSDLRVDAQRGLLGRACRYYLARAEAVLYSTPDLGEALRRWRPDASYLPNPLPPELVGDLGQVLHSLRPDPAFTLPPRPTPAPPATPGTDPNQTDTDRTVANPPGSARVFINARFDDTKGGLALVEAARQMVAAGLEVYGIDWGTYAEQARAAGVRLYPLAPQRQYLQLMAQADLVVGQQHIGSLGMSDLQALALGRPLLVKCDDRSIPVLRSTAQTVVAQVIELAADPDRARQAAAEGRRWVLEHHDPARAVERLRYLYAKLLG